MPIVSPEDYCFSKNQNPVSHSSRARDSQDGWTRFRMPKLHPPPLPAAPPASLDNLIGIPCIPGINRLSKISQCSRIQLRNSLPVPNRDPGGFPEYHAWEAEGFSPGSPRSEILGPQLYDRGTKFSKVNVFSYWNLEARNQLLLWGMVAFA